ncbi:hypothetical protein MKZ38_003195 [Zalerion maritima]|uniref:Transglutaminase-like domain-containing protein n=1 Tax=Zalerion maritima TaxID=339359 RepID=A0AAD5RZ81_9PEZI|nr:hypothetical protein MKZ38_003195 [Zalerion maritima]
MADIEEPKFNSLADRIAALNNQPNFSSATPPPSAPPTAGKHRPPPPPPPAGGRPQHESRSYTQPVPTVTQPAATSPTIPPRPQRTSTSGPNVNKLDSPPSLPNRNHGGAPPLPTRKASHASQLPSPSQASPALPPRRPSGTQQLAVRRGSNSSELSYLSNFSALSIGGTSISSSDTQGHRKLPPLDQAKLPPLPPTRRELEARAKEEADAHARKTNCLVSAYSAPVVPKVRSLDLAPSPQDRPALPPRLPSRPAKSPQPAENGTPPISGQGRRLPPTPSTWKRPETNVQPPPLPGTRPRPEADNINGVIPPPVPVSSRPSFAQVKAVAEAAQNATPMQSQATNSPSPQQGNNCCLICRDFSGPDSVAAQYPRQNLPRQDPVGYLAHVLCGPFPSPTDKARAIFTWCHHNIAYDVYSFFNKCVKHHSTEDLIFTGQAVCMGYSKVYHDIAVRAGLECVEISGHGKGFGFTDLKPGDLTPKQDSNHAWNAVRVDGGEWKLIDSCWGAGNVTQQHTYEKRFTPAMFTMSNERFGKRHFPTNKTRFFLPVPRPGPSWEEYVWGSSDKIGVERCNWYTTANEEGLDEQNFEPYAKHISIYNSNEPSVRFQFAKLCPHWKVEVHGKGKPFLWLLEIWGVDGRAKEHRYVNQNDAWYWVDVPRRELGAPGQKIKLMVLSNLNGRDGRGLTRTDWESKGYGSWSFQSLADWELVR